MRNFILILGTINFANPESGSVVQRSMHKVEHKEYNDVTIANDIAVIKLPQPVEFSGKYIYVLHTVYKLQHLESLALVM
jgi:hypothetical protein